MENVKDGVTGSSSKPEPSSPNAITSHPDEKNVSTMNTSATPRRKLYLMECDEGSDGSLSKCKLIRLTEADEPQHLTKVPIDQGLPASGEVGFTQCTPEKCPIPLSKYKRAMKKGSKTEGETDKKA
jgi:hypothetical protein